MRGLRYLLLAGGEGLARLRIPILGRVEPFQPEAPPGLSWIQTIDFDIPQEVFDAFMAGRIDREWIERRFYPTDGTLLPRPHPFVEQLRAASHAANRLSRGRERQAIAAEIAMRVLDVHAPAYEEITDHDDAS